MNKISSYEKSIAKNVRDSNHSSLEPTTINNNNIIITINKNYSSKETSSKRNNELDYMRTVSPTETTPARTGSIIRTRKKKEIQ